MHSLGGMVFFLGGGGFQQTDRCTGGDNISRPLLWQARRKSRLGGWNDPSKEELHDSTHFHFCGRGLVCILQNREKPYGLFSLGNVILEVGIKSFSAIHEGERPSHSIRNQCLMSNLTRTWSPSKSEECWRKASPWPKKCLQVQSDHLVATEKALEFWRANQNGKKNPLPPPKKNIAQHQAVSFLWPFRASLNCHVICDELWSVLRERVLFFQVLRCGKCEN